MKTLEEIRQSNNSINQLAHTDVFQLFGTLTRRKFSDVFLWMLLSKIFHGLHNVAFYHTDKVHDGKQGIRLQRLIDFITENADALIYYYYRYGYIIICPVFNRKGEVAKWYIPDYGKVRKNKDGEPCDTEGKPYKIVYYSQVYRFERRSDFDVVRENLNAIDTYAGSDIYLTETLGAFGILCGKNMPIQHKDKEDFFERLKRKVGIGRDRMQIIPFNSEVDFKQVNLPIKDLDLSGKVKEQLQIVSGYFGIPYDLLPLAGNSTYDNQKQAIINFYSSCISPLAEVLLSVLRYASRYEALVPSRQLWFRIDNVPELAKERPIDTDYKAALLDLHAKMKAQGFDTTAVENEINTFAI